MIVTLPHIQTRKNRSTFFLFQSDQHLEHEKTDRNRIRGELEWAKDVNARVLMGGDLCDLILPRDLKRYTAGRLAKELREHGDPIINATIDYVVEFLGPYANYIHTMGYGNHETAVIKYLHFDILQMIVRELQRCVTRKGHVIHRTGYCAGIRQTFTAIGGGNATQLRIFHHHGRGGNAPKSKGMLDKRHFEEMIDGCDIIWFGHKHHHTSDKPNLWVFPSKGREIYTKEVRRFQTGTYATCAIGDQFDDRGNYQIEYGIERGFGQPGIGGFKMEARVRSGSRARQRAIVQTILFDEAN